MSADSGSKYIDVALPVPLRQTFTYSIPDVLLRYAQVGSRVIVPFGRRLLTGYIVAFQEFKELDPDLDPNVIKPIDELLDDEPLLTGEIIDLARWAADYYMSSWGDMLKAALPAGINSVTDEVLTITEAGRETLHNSAKLGSAKLEILGVLARQSEATVSEINRSFDKAKAARAVKDLTQKGLVTMHRRRAAAKVKARERKFVRLTDNEQSTDKKLSKLQIKIIETLAKNGGGMFLTDLQTEADVGASPVNTLAKYGIVEVSMEESFRDPLEKADLPPSENFSLTADQQTALDKICDAIYAQRFETFLIHGVTGSGKTEVYIRSMLAALRSGLSSLMLVPEIALTPVFSRRLRSVFGREVAILHSNLSAGERFDEWRRIRSGEARIAIGTRSAIYAPLKDIGLIIVDEEHDASYRQHEPPFYNARDLAVIRANFAGAAVVLGSATPSMESFHNVESGKYTLVTMPKRVGDRPLAQAELIDMRRVFKEAGKDAVLSPQLIAAINETHARGEQTIILLNRRGFSQFVLCRSCGESLRCVNCDITLTFHKNQHRIVCHYCNYSTEKPEKCPFCESEHLYFIGEGTEQMETILAGQFPTMKIARVDRDSMRGRGRLENTLASFADGKIDMLVGTQMIAKGHDFPNVTLVGVISVDIGLGLPDLRAAERTFQLLTQVAGRAGRGDLPGKVLIQTYHPEHYALTLAAEQNYNEFYKRELNFRTMMSYPPTNSLAMILVKHGDAGRARATADAIRKYLDAANTDKSVRILGPAFASLSKLRGEFRIQILLKAKNRRRMREIIDAALRLADEKKTDLKGVFVEIDPINLM